jgi:hypothetical protein
MWVIGGAILGSYIGGALASDNLNPFTEQYWNDGWQGAVVGGIVGAGAGAIAATVFAGTAAGGTTAALMTSSTTPGTASLGWSMTSSALISGNMNMASTAIFTGGDLDQVWKSGVSGLISGAISGGVNYQIGTKYHEVGFWKGMGIHGTVGGTTNLIDGSINGMKGEELFWHTMKGAGISGIAGGVSEGLRSRIDGKSFWTGSDKKVRMDNGCWRNIHRDPLTLNIKKGQYSAAVFPNFDIGDKNVSIPIGFGWDFNSSTKMWNTTYTHILDGTETYFKTWYNFPILFPFIPFIH